jgi:hypothetical protein
MRVTSHVRLAFLTTVLLGGCSLTSRTTSSASQSVQPNSCDAAGAPGIQTVFIILMENHNWSSISGNSSANYINNTLLPMASHAENYNNVPNLHPSLPNYLWLEAGSNFGVTADGDPSQFPQNTTAHLVTQLEAAGVNWKEYAENITGSSCPLSTSGLYAPKHVPFVYFDDVMNNATRCTTHVRPYTELATDLSSGKASGYNFITPNLCDDMHNPLGCAQLDEVANGDKWLSTEVPKILASSAFQNNGALFITWDESEGSNVPIGMIVLSPLAKGGGYTGNVAYTHSSTLRTMQEIFGVSPFLGDAANATDLADLFKPGAIGGTPGTCSSDAGSDTGGGGDDASSDTGAGNDASADTGGGGDDAASEASGDDGAADAGVGNDAADAALEGGADAGAGSDAGSDAAQDAGASSCAHPICTVGTQLVATCDPCAAQVCAQDNFCCSSSWDQTCVGEVTSICGQTCP